MMFLFAFISQDVLLVVHRAAGVEDGPAQCSAQGCLANVRWSRHGSNFTKNVLLWERAVAADGACVAQDQHTACFKNVPVSFSMRASFFSFGYRLLLERGRKQGENVAPLHFLMSHPSSFPKKREELARHGFLSSQHTSQPNGAAHEVSQQDHSHGLLVVAQGKLLEVPTYLLVAKVGGIPQGSELLDSSCLDQGTWARCVERVVPTAVYL